MRIGIVKKTSYTRQPLYAEDEIDRLNNRLQCINCGHDRVILCKITNNYTIMRACINKNCFLYTNLNKLTTWITQDENK